MKTLGNLQNICVYPDILWILTVGAIEFIRLSMLLFFSVCRLQSWNRLSTTSSHLWHLAISFSLLRVPTHVPSSLYTSSSGKWLPAFLYLSCLWGLSFPNSAYSLCVQRFSSVLFRFWVEVIILLSNLYFKRSWNFQSLSNLLTGRWTNWLLHFTNEMTFTLLRFRLRGYFSKFLSSMYVFQDKWEFRFKKKIGKSTYLCFNWNYNHAKWIEILKTCC